MNNKNNDSRFDTPETNRLFEKLGGILVQLQENKNHRSADVLDELPALKLRHMVYRYEETLTQNVRNSKKTG